MPSRFFRAASFVVVFVQDMKNGRGHSARRKKRNHACKRQHGTPWFRVTLLLFIYETVQLCNSLLPRLVAPAGEGKRRQAPSLFARSRCPRAGVSLGSARRRCSCPFPVQDPGSALVRKTKPYYYCSVLYYFCCLFLFVCLYSSSLASHVTTLLSR